MHFFLKSIDCWKTIEIGWTELVDANIELANERNTRLSNDKALHTLCQALLSSEFTKISNCGTAQEAWQILETTYEGILLIKLAKLQMLVSRFEEIKMMDDDTFGEFLLVCNLPHFVGQNHFFVMMLFNKDSAI
jgi:hypothetical protein